MSNYLFPPCAQTAPFSNVDTTVVNPFNQHNPASFGSNETNLQYGLKSAPSAVDGANSYIPGVTTGGGKIKKNTKAKTIKRKIKNIVSKYKMRGGKKSRNTMFRKLKKSLGLKGGSKKSKKIGHKKTKTNTKKRMTKKYRGGYYQQYMSNVPYTPGYSTGGPLSPSLSALANPPTIHQYNHCSDNYNHYTHQSMNS